MKLTQDHSRITIRLAGGTLTPDEKQMLDELVHSFDHYQDAQNGVGTANVHQAPGGVSFTINYKTTAEEGSILVNVQKLGESLWQASADNKPLGKVPDPTGDLEQVKQTMINQLESVFSPPKG